MRRHLLTLLSTLSLVVCAAVAWLWWATGRPDGERVYWFERPGELHGLRVAGGRSTWVVPPAAGTARGEADARARLVGLRNRDSVWLVGPALTEPGEPDRYLISGGFDDRDRTAVAYGLADPLSTDPVRPLLDALGDPDRFVAAHRVLRWRAGAASEEATVERSAGRYVADLDGLRLDLGPAAAGPPTASNVAADPGQMRALRRRWAQWLAVPAASVPLPAVVLVTALAPVARVASAVARRGRRASRDRRGLCPGCGYDLRGTSGQCPECGAEPKGATA
jgi:hypothetical protein